MNITCLNPGIGEAEAEELLAQFKVSPNHLTKASPFSITPAPTHKKSPPMFTKTYVSFPRLTEYTGSSLLDDEEKTTEGRGGEGKKEERVGERGEERRGEGRGGKREEARGGEKRGERREKEK